MTRAYSSGPFPRLIVEVRVRLADASSHERLDGKLDTGADITGLPINVLRELRAIPAGEAAIRCAQDQVPQSVPTYFVEVCIDGAHYHYVEVVAMPRDTAVIGLDLLNEYILHADGPAKLFELASPA